jgi:Tfp pilus assembly protein PilF
MPAIPNLAMQGRSGHALQAQKHSPRIQWLRFAMSYLTAEQVLDLARNRQNAGAVQAAESLYRQFLSSQPDNAQASEQLGLLLFETGRLTEATDFLRRAAELDQSNPAFRCNLGLALAQARRLEEAAANCRQALAIQPNLIEAHRILVNVLSQNHEPAQAAVVLRQALLLHPQNPELHNDLGIIFGQMGKLPDAIASYRQAIALKPDFAEALFNLGSALKELHRLDEAVAAFRTALHLKPDHADAHNNLGNVLRLQGKLDEALPEFEKAILQAPRSPHAHVNRSAVLYKMLCFDEAAASYRHAITLAPDFADAHFGLSLVLLHQGNFDEGWREYEWRRARPQWHGHRFPQPQWTGSDLAAKHILLHAEQGLGDTIQFVRYAPLVKQRGGHVTLLCPPQLKRLLERQCNIDSVISETDPLPPFDLHCPLMSLPHVFGTQLDSIPAPAPYLTADPDLAARWRHKLAHQAAQFKVGLVWGAPAQYTEGSERFMHVTDLRPLAAIPGVALFSLQTGHAATQLRTSQLDAAITDCMPDITDFADTAALIANLDLIISIDTAVAHLAAALAKPTWLPLPVASEWRWLTARNDSPWYPTMRLFRQEHPGKWESPIARMASELQYPVNSVHVRPSHP